MDILQAMHARHSVRAFTGQAIPPSSVQALQEELARSNAESGLDLRLITDEPQAFSCFLAHYGKFSNVRNYIAVIGDKTPLAEERAGYYGERAVLLAQRLGLNTCWVALSFAQGKTKKSLCIGKGKKLFCLIAIGYGATQGVQHRSKSFAQVCNVQNPPAWFRAGVEAALLAPTAINQQKFRFELVGEQEVRAVQTGGFCRGLDLGIVKYHFECGAGKENFTWVKE